MQRYIPNTEAQQKQMLAEAGLKAVSTGFSPTCRKTCVLKPRSACRKLSASPRC
jgi:hypothetical protein